MTSVRNEESTRQTAPSRSVASRVTDIVFGRREASIALVTLALVIYFTSVNSAFLTEPNLRVVSHFTYVVAIIAVGQVMLLICGEIDLSAGHVYALTPFLMLYMMDAGVPMTFAVLAALVVASGIGFVNGFITIKFGVPSFIATLGMAFLLNGLTLIFSGGFPKPAPREGVQVEIFGGFPFVGIMWALAITAVMHTVLTNTRWGVYTFSTGGNPIGAREAGVPTPRIKIGNFMLTSTLAGIAGVLESTRVASIDPLAGGFNLMFFAVASAVIGGTALAGGSGTIIGGFLGALFLAVLRDGFTIEGISAFTFNVILGAAIIVSMILNVRLARLRKGATLT
jgi:simple sugar transport system permease protein